MKIYMQSHWKWLTLTLTLAGTTHSSHIFVVADKCTLNCASKSAAEGLLSGVRCVHLWYAFTNGSISFFLEISSGSTGGLEMLERCGGLPVSSSYIIMPNDHTVTIKNKWVVTVEADGSSNVWHMTTTNNMQKLHQQHQQQRNVPSRTLKSC